MNLLAALLCIPAALVPASQGEKPAAAPAKSAASDMSPADRAAWNVQRFSYPLDTCVVSGEKLGLKPTEFVVEGRLVRTCCGDCRKQVETSPGDAFAKIDAAVIAAQKQGYPLDVCAVSGAKLDEKALDRVVGTKLVRVANEEAATKLTAEPKPALAKLDAAYVKAQLASYPLKTCVITDEPLGTPEMGEPVDAIYGTQLVRFCCAGCIKSFEKKADVYLAKITDARKTAR